MIERRGNCGDQSIRRPTAIALHAIGWGRPAEASTRAEGAPLALPFTPLRAVMDGAQTARFKEPLALWSGICTTGTVFVWTMLPDTNDQTREEMGQFWLHPDREGAEPAINPS